MSNKTTSPYITVAMPAGRVGPAVFQAISRVVQQYGVDAYLTTTQNMRLLDVPSGEMDRIKQELAAAGAIIKGPGMFPMPRVCAGKPYCKLAVADPSVLSAMIMERLGGRTGVKPKFKIAIAGCPANCSSALLIDIGVVATKSGFDVYVGGKGGAMPMVGKRIIRKAAAERVVDVIEQLVDFHDRKTSQKKRFYKLMQEPDFPFPVD